MEIVKESTGLSDPHLVLKATIGNYLPQTITIYHNGRQIEYIQSDNK